MQGNTSLDIVGENVAKKQYAIGLATAAYARDVDEADARLAEITDAEEGMLAPTKEYLDDQAQLEHDYNIALAQAAATRDEELADGGDPDDAWAEYDEEVETANEEHQTDAENLDESWSAADAQAISTWYVRLATDEHDATELWINAEVQHVAGNAAAQDYYDHAADALLPTTADIRDSISNSFAQQEANSWIAALTGFASDDPSPWATYILSDETRYRDDYLFPSDSAQRTLDDAEAGALQVESDAEADAEAQGQVSVEQTWAATEAGDSFASYSAELEAAQEAAELAAHGLPGLEPVPTPPTSFGPADAVGIADAASTVTDEVATNSDLVTPPELAAIGALFKSAASAAADAALTTAGYRNPVGGLVTAAVASATPAAAAAVASAGSNDPAGKSEPAPSPWTKQELQLVMEAIAKNDVRLSHFGEFWAQQNVVVQDSSAVKSWIPIFGRDSYPFRVTVTRGEPRNFQGEAFKIGEINRVLVEIPPGTPSLDAAVLVMKELEKGGSLADAYIEYLLGVSPAKSFSPLMKEEGGTKSFEGASRAKKIKVLHDAAADADFYLSTIIGSMGAGGALVIAWKDQQQGNTTGFVLGLASLVPIGMLLSRGLRTLRVVAQNKEVVEISARALGMIADDHAADISRQVLAGLKEAKTADDVIRMLEQQGLFRLLSKSEIPSFASGKFDDWFDSMAPAVLKRYYADKDLKKYISDQLRGGGGVHEFLTVGTADHWKAWKVTASELRSKYSMPIDEFNKRLKDGIKHNGGLPGGKYPGSKSFHDALAGTIIVLVQGEMEF